ncbi:hypothetical protein Tco_0961140 [Tanacetum coccineum]
MQNQHNSPKAKGITGLAHLKAPRSQPKYSGKFCSSEEPEFETPQQGQTQSWLMTLASSADKPSKTFDELMSTPIDFSAYIPKITLALSEKLNWENPKGSDYPFDLTNPLPLVMSGNCQKVPVDYFFNNDLKHLKDLVPFIMGSVKVCFDKNAFWGISNWREQVEVMRKHGYGYLKEIIVRKADNDLYRFKEGDFLRLRNNDIEDMLLLLERERHRLTNLLGNDVFGTYANSIMYVHNQAFGYQKRVKDLHLGVKSYQKKINVTKPETTKLGIRKRDPYTPYQDPQGFIYVDNNGRNRLMRSDELYKFSDRTLTGLQTSLDDITKNIQRKSTCQRGEMEYIVHHKEKS